LENTTCKICEGTSELKLKHQILGKYEIGYFHCKNCGFTQTEKPYWLPEAYAESMNLGDTGQVIRNTIAQRILLAVIYFFFDGKKKFLDYAGGYGLFTRSMRDAGLDFYWNDKYTKNLLSKGFDCPLESGPFELISTFECFEHLENPREEIAELLQHTDSIFFTTQLIPSPIPGPDWWYYGFDHGQHIAFHSKGSMMYLCQKYGLNFYSKRGFHLLTRKKLSPFAYKLVVELAFRGWLGWTQKAFGSRTHADHVALTKENANRKAASI
jgi:hypothetical protein